MNVQSGMQRALPLAGVRVVELTHMVMGPTCGMILGDLGADVIKVEPLAGDNTRRLPGLGAGFFRTGMGEGASPVMANCCMCCADRSTQFSNRLLWMR